MMKYSNIIFLIQNIRKIKGFKTKPNWVLMKMFGFGSGTAYKKCIEIGIDPDSKLTERKEK